MSLLYPNEGKTTLSVEITKLADRVNFYFTSDCGKFGTDECIDDIDVTIEELLSALQAHEERGETP